MLITQNGLRVYQIFESSIESKTSSTSSLNLNDSTNRLKISNNFQSNLNQEEIINFLNELQSANTNESDKFSMQQTYLMPNVNFRKSDQYGFLISQSCDVFFFKFSSSFPIKKTIWHKQLNSILLKYFKVDIDV